MSHVPPVVLRCECGHGDAMHDIRKDGTRSVCSVSTGPGATHCECKSFQPQHTAQENQ